MILTGAAIKEAIACGEITITPYAEKQVSTNSYDFRLGNTLKIYKDKILDPKKKPTIEELVVPETGLQLSPNRLYLGHTLEKMGSNKYVPIIKGRSSIARLGLFVHITADLIDIGSYNQWTLQLYPVLPITIYPQMLIAQVTFWKTLGTISLYKGKYQGSMGPCESLIYLDFLGENNVS